MSGSVALHMDIVSATIVAAVFVSITVYWDNPKSQYQVINDSAFIHRHAQLILLLI